MKVRNAHPNGAQHIPALGIAEWKAGEILDIPVEHARTLIDGGDYEAAEPWPTDEAIAPAEEV